MKSKIVLALVCVSLTSACNLDKKAPETKVEAIKAGDPCGTNGVIADRVSDCARAPDSQVEGYRLVTRHANGSKVWLDMSTGVMVAGVSLIKQTFVEAQKSCRDLGTIAGFAQPMYFRVAAKSEITDLLKKKLSSIVDIQHKSFLTSDQDSQGWINVINADTIQIEGQGHPETFQAHALCVATYGTIQMESVYKIQSPFYSEASCKTFLDNDVDAVEISKQLVRKTTESAEFKCGGSIQKRGEIKTKIYCEQVTSTNSWSANGSGTIDFNCF